MFTLLWPPAPPLSLAREPRHDTFSNVKVGIILPADTPSNPNLLNCRHSSLWGPFLNRERAQCNHGQLERHLASTSIQGSPGAGAALSSGLLLRHQDGLGLLKGAL